MSSNPRRRSPDEHHEAQVRVRTSAHPCLAMLAHRASGSVCVIARDTARLSVRGALVTMQSYVISDPDTGRRLAVGRDAITADEKARALTKRGHAVRIDAGPPLPDVPPGYELLPPRRLAKSTLRSAPAKMWESDLRSFPGEWGPWGAGHWTANVAHALHDRGMVEIAVPRNNGRGRFQYRRTLAGDRLLSKLASERARSS